MKRMSISLCLSALLLLACVPGSTVKANPQSEKVAKGVMASGGATSVSGETGDKSVNNSAGEVEIVMLKYKFVPQVLEIKAGQTVRWINKEKRQYHSIWFEQLGEVESDYLFPDETFQKTFNKPGEYPYRCGPHEEMIGKIIVR